MMEPRRLLVLVAALGVTVGVGVATAQTVIVRNAPPGATIELVRNAATIGSAAAGADGGATLAVALPPGVSETDVHVYVDVCDKLRRVFLVERGLQPPPQGRACDRKEIYGWFVVRRQITTLVLDLGGPNPSLWLRQGPVPSEWLSQGPAPLAAAAHRRAPTGLVLFGSGSLVKFSDALTVACGTVSQCAGKDFRATYTAGVAYWITRFLAAEASYMKPAKVTADGSGDTFRFNSFLDARILTITGKVGVPIGPVRLYGQAGANYHQATSSTTQTIDDVTVTVDDVDQTIKGGTQTLELKTAGWGWLFGGGFEAWVAPSFAIYVEGGHARLRGAAVGGGEGGIDDRVTFVLVGARVHIGR